MNKEEGREEGRWEEDGFLYLALWNLHRVSLKTEGEIKHSMPGNKVWQERAIASKKFSQRGGAGLLHVNVSISGGMKQGVFCKHLMVLAIGDFHELRG